MSRTDRQKHKQAKKALKSKVYIPKRQREEVLPIWEQSPAGRALFWTDFIVGLSNNIQEVFCMYRGKNQHRRMGERSRWRCWPGGGHRHLAENGIHVGEPFPRRNGAESRADGNWSNPWGHWHCQIAWGGQYESQGKVKDKMMANTIKELIQENENEEELLG